jgi:hypothetical protein
MLKDQILLGGEKKRCYFRPSSINLYNIGILPIDLKASLQNSRRNYNSYLKHMHKFEKASFWTVGRGEVVFTRHSSSLKLPLYPACKPKFRGCLREMFPPA